MTELIQQPFFFYSTIQRLLIILSSSAAIIIFSYLYCFEPKLAGIKTLKQYSQKIRTAPYPNNAPARKEIKPITASNFIKKFTALSQLHHLHIDNIQLLPIKEQKHKKLHPINLSVIGQFRNTYQLLQQLSKLNFLLSWTKVSIHSLAEHDLKTEIRVVLYEKIK